MTRKMSKSLARLLRPLQGSGGSRRGPGGTSVAIEERRLWAAQESVSAVALLYWATGGPEDWRRVGVVEHRIGSSSTPLLRFALYARSARLSLWQVARVADLEAENAALREQVELLAARAEELQAQLAEDIYTAKTARGVTWCAIV